LIFGLLLKILDVAQLVHGEDVVVGRAHVVLEIDAVLAVVGEVALGLELVNTVKAVVAPALAHFELALINAENHLRRAQVVDQLDSVFVHLGLHRLHALRSLVHFQEDRNIGSLRVLSVAVWVNFQAPRDTVGEESRRVDWLL